MVNDLFKLIVQINRPADFPDGVYTATITITTTENSINVPVSMQKITTDQSSDAGFHYILLINTDADKKTYGVVSTAVDGTYKFEIKGIEPGQYLLAAGTDMDNDGYINDSGEAFGMYPSLEEPQILEISEDVSGLDFLTGFNIQLSSIFGVAPDQAGMLKKTTGKWLIPKK